jgi:hypothetical protein
MNYKKMWKQLETEMVGLKIKGEDLVKKYAGTKSGGQKKRDAEATIRVIAAVQGRMVQMELDQKATETKSEEPEG